MQKNLKNVSVTIDFDILFCSDDPLGFEHRRNQRFHAHALKVMQSRAGFSRAWCLRSWFQVFVSHSSI